MSDDGKVAVDYIGVAVKKLGGRVLNGVVERHFGFEGVDVAGTIGMAGPMIGPVVTNAFRAQEAEPFLDTLQRRVVWSFGVAGTVVILGGLGWAVWKYFGKPVVED